MKGIMAIKGHGRRFVLAGIDILTYIIITAIYLGIDYLFLNDAIGNVGEYIINSLILLACISISRVVFRIYINVWRYTNTVAFMNMVISDVAGGVAAWFVVYFTLDSNVTNHFLAVSSLNLIAYAETRLDEYLRTGIPSQMSFTNFLVMYMNYPYEEATEITECYRKWEHRFEK